MLGFQRKRWFQVKLSSLRPNGGPAPAICVRVIKRYPIIFYERTAEGRRYRRNQKAEDHAYSKHQQYCQQKMQDFIKSEEMVCQKKIEIVEKAEQYKREESSFQRNSCSYFNVLIRGVDSPGLEQRSILTVWLRGDDARVKFSPGNILQLIGIQVRHLGKRGLELSTGKKCLFRVIKKEFPQISTCSTISELLNLLPGNEIDVIAIVLAVGEPHSRSSRKSKSDMVQRTLLVGDASKNILAVTITEDEECHFFSLAPVPGQQMIFANLRYDGYDEALEVHNASTSVESEFTVRIQERPQCSRHWEFLKMFCRTDTGKECLQDKMSKAIQMLQGDVKMQTQVQHLSVPKAVIARGVFCTKGLEFRKCSSYLSSVLEAGLKPGASLSKVLSRAKFALSLRLDSATQTWPMIFNASTFRRLLDKLVTSKN